jgi:hypothetical protein
VERTDDDVFVVRPATAGGWDAIAAGLARLLVRLAACDARHCVVVDSVERQYVQLMWLPDGDLWAEANLQPAVDEASTEAKRDALVALGWNAPDPAGRYAGNHWRRWHGGEELTAALVALCTCVEVFGATACDDMRVTVLEAVGVP